MSYEWGTYCSGTSLSRFPKNTRHHLTYHRKFPSEMNSAPVHAKRWGMRLATTKLLYRASFWRAAPSSREVRTWPPRREAWRAGCLRTQRIVPLLVAHSVTPSWRNIFWTHPVRSWRSSLKPWRERSSLKSGTYPAHLGHSLQMCPRRSFWSL